MQPATSPRCHRAVQRSGGQPGLHPGVDAVANDAVGERVFDRAEVELALAGAVLSDIAELQPVWRIGGEITSDQIVVHRWAGLTVLAAPALTERAPPAVVRADPPRGARRHRLTRVTGLINQEAIAELGIISVSVEQGVGPIRLGEFGVGDRLGQPPVIGLAGELAPGTSPPRGSRRRRAPLRAGRPFSRQIGLRQIGRGPAQHLVLLLEQFDPPPGLT